VNQFSHDSLSVQVDEWFHEAPLSLQTYHLWKSDTDSYDDNAKIEAKYAKTKSPILSTHFISGLKKIVKLLSI
jgi:hypothetical protein